MAIRLITAYLVFGAATMLHGFSLLFDKEFIKALSEGIKELVESKYGLLIPMQYEWIYPISARFSIILAGIEDGIKWPVYAGKRIISRIQFYMLKRKYKLILKRLKKVNENFLETMNNTCKTIDEIIEARSKEEDKS